MSEKEVIDIFIKLIGSAIPGYLSYYILYKTNKINLTKNRAEDNKIMLALLSTINIFIGLLVFNKINQNNIAWLSIAIVIVLTILSVIVIPFVTPLISKLTIKLINFLRKKDGLGEIDNNSRYTSVFDHSRPTRVAIFDFSRNYIVSGVVSEAPASNEFEYFDMVLSEIDDNESPKQSKFIANFKQRQAEGCGTYRLYVDFEKKVNIHVFIEN